MDSAESSSRYPGGHGVGHTRGVPRGRGRAHRPSIPDFAPQSNSYVATENCHRRLDVITRNRSRATSSREEHSSDNHANEASTSSMSHTHNQIFAHKRTIFEPLTLGGPQCSCQHCGALFWYD